MDVTVLVGKLFSSWCYSVFDQCIGVVYEYNADGEVKLYIKQDIWYSTVFELHEIIQLSLYIIVWEILATLVITENLEILRMLMAILTCDWPIRSWALIYHMLFEETIE